jgi:RNA polymerase sigma-70 factor (ECF subfamily)
MTRVSDDATRRLRFQALYEANYSAILGYALRRAPRDEAGDVVADTFLVAWRRISDVPHGHEARLWLYGAARRVLANRARSERRRNRIGAQLAAETPPAAQGDPPETDAVARAFGRLRPEERELLALVAWEGLSPAEASQVLGCSPNAARIRLYRARRKLVRELEECALGAAAVGLGRTT